MEMNESKAARHKIFHRKPSFVDKKMYPKSRFCELTTDEIQKIIDKAVPETTEKSHKVRDEVIYWYVSVKFPLKFAKFQM